MNNKKLSVVIPTKNRADDLMNLVDSIIHQSIKPDELIIIDQSDSRKSKDLVEDKWKQVRNSQLIYILNPEIKGLVDAKRHGTKLASNELVCFLDDDLILDDRFLNEITKPFQDNKDILGSSGVFINFPERSRLYSIMYAFFHKGIFSDPRPEVYRQYEGYNNKLLPSNVLWGGITTWRLDVLNKVPFDHKNFLFMMEDFDYSAKVRAKIGANFIINPNARAIHNHSDTNRASVTEQESKKISEYIAYYKKRKAKFIDFVCLIWLLIGLFLHACYESIKIRKFSLLKAYFNGIYIGKNFLKE